MPLPKRKERVCILKKKKITVRVKSDDARKIPCWKKIETDEKLVVYYCRRPNLQSMRKDKGFLKG